MESCDEMSREVLATATLAIVATDSAPARSTDRTAETFTACRGFLTKVRYEGARMVNFVTLNEVLGSLVRAAPNRRHPKGDDPKRKAVIEEEEWSAAADSLGAAIHNARDEAPRWYQSEFDVRSDLEDGAVSRRKSPRAIPPVEGVAMLRHVAGWADRQLNLRTQYAMEQVAIEREFGRAAADAHVPAIPVDSGKYPIADVLRSREIGFDRTEVAGFLDLHGIPHELQRAVESTQTSRQLGSPTMASGAESGPSIERPEQQTTPFPMTKSGLVKAHKHHWTSILDDLAHAAENGLALAAKAAARGWWESRALEWARTRGKLQDGEHGGLRNLPSFRHRMDDD
jgi:hypothetical protein